MRRSLALLAGSALLLPAAVLVTAASAPAADQTGTLTVCLVGLGKHGKVNIGGGTQNLETGQAISAASRGYQRYSGCHTGTVDARSRTWQSYAPKAPYRLRSISSKQTNGNNARVKVPAGQAGFVVVMGTSDNVVITLSYGRAS